MTLKELQKIVNRAVKEGYGEAKVVITHFNEDEFGETYDDNREASDACYETKEDKMIFYVQE